MPKQRRGRPPTRKPPPPKRLEGSKTLIYKLLAFSVMLIGLAASIVTFVPRLVVDSSGQIDPARPTPISFTITNSGVIPLTNVQPAIGLCELWTEPAEPTQSCKGNLDARFVRPSWFTKKLSPDEKHVIRLDEVIKVSQPARFGGADVSIIISYYPWLIPFRREAEFRFYTRKEEDGMLSWIPRPLDQ